MSKRSIAAVDTPATRGVTDVKRARLAASSSSSSSSEDPAPPLGGDVTGLCIQVNTAVHKALRPVSLRIQPGVMPYQVMYADDYHGTRIMWFALSDVCTGRVGGRHPVTFFSTCPDDALVFVPGGHIFDESMRFMMSEYFSAWAAGKPSQERFWADFLRQQSITTVALHRGAPSLVHYLREHPLGHDIVDATLMPVPKTTDKWTAWLDSERDALHALQWYDDLQAHLDGYDPEAEWPQEFWTLLGRVLFQLTSLSKPDVHFNCLRGDPNHLADQLLRPLAADRVFAVPPRGDVYIFGYSHDPAEPVVALPAVVSRLIQAEIDSVPQEAVDSSSSSSSSSDDIDEDSSE